MQPIPTRAALWTAFLGDPAYSRAGRSALTCWTVAVAIDRLSGTLNESSPSQLIESAQRG